MYFIFIYFGVEQLQYIHFYWKFSYQSNALCWLVVQLKEKKFYPGPELEPGPLAFRANALTNWVNQDKYQSMTELIS